MRRRLSIVEHQSSEPKQGFSPTDVQSGTPIVESLYLTALQAVEHLKLKTLSALYYHIKENRLPTLRVGNRYRFDKRELDAWLHGFNSRIEMVLAQKRA